MNALTPDEVAIIQLALQQLVEDNEAVSQNQNYPLTPEARMLMKDMLRVGKSALAKITLTSGHAVRMDAYNEGDETEFLTKES